MRSLMNKRWPWPWRRPAWVGCAWHEGHMVGVQLQPLMSHVTMVWQIQTMHACVHAWGSQKLSQGQAAGLPWERLHAGMGTAHMDVALACPSAWVASGEHAAGRHVKRRVVLAEIQVQAAQAIGESYTDVCFDALATTEGHWQWWATSRRWIEQVSAEVLPLSVRLRSVAPQHWAQHEALVRLHGGESSLQVQSAMDWQFSKTPQHPEADVKSWLQTWAMTAQGLRLAACGMALRAN